jgi:predicted RNA-binding Zn ribbon-like protein
LVFAHDTEVALAAAAALVNSAHDDTLTTAADLAEYVTRWRFTGQHVGDDRELAAVRALRPRLERLWHVAEDEAVRIVNGMLSDARALPQLVKHDDWDYHLHATTPDTELAVRMAVEAAMAIVDVIRSGELARLRICAAPDCADVVVDLSRNRSRRFCENGCGNRSNVAAYRARRAATR